MRCLPTRRFCNSRSGDTTKADRTTRQEGWRAGNTELLTDLHGAGKESSRAAVSLNERARLMMFAGNATRRAKVIPPGYHVSTFPFPYGFLPKCEIDIIHQKRVRPRRLNGLCIVVRSLQI